MTPVKTTWAYTYIHEADFKIALHWSKVMNLVLCAYDEYSVGGHFAAFHKHSDVSRV